MWSWLCRKLGELVARYLQTPARRYRCVPFTVNDPATLKRFLRPADVLLVEGCDRISVVIKYLTQSTWSHAAVYIGDAVDRGEGDDNACLFESDLANGAVAVPLSKYEGQNTRICRPVGLTEPDRAKVIAFLVDSIGTAYDLRNIIDLARYLMPTPPVPVRWRRRMLTLGSGDPTRAICSTLIAQAFQSVRYPILPRIETERSGDLSVEREILHIRHHSLFTPRDFDVSPYFKVVKPTLETKFDYRSLTWSEGSERATAS